MKNCLEIQLQLTIYVSRLHINSVHCSSKSIKFPLYQIIMRASQLLRLQVLLPGLTPMHWVFFSISGSATAKHGERALHASTCGRSTPKCFLPTRAAAFICIGGVALAGAPLPIYSFPYSLSRPLAGRHRPAEYTRLAVLHATGGGSDQARVPIKRSILQWARGVVEEGNERRRSHGYRRAKPWRPRRA